MALPRISRLLSLAVVSTLCACVCGCEDENDARKLPKVARASLLECGGKVLVMPPPPEMIRSDGISLEWDQAIAASLPPDHRLLGYYSTFEDRVRIERQMPPVSARDCILHIRGRDEKRDITPFGLNRLRSQVEDEIEDGILTNQIGGQLAKAIAASMSQTGADDGADKVPTVTAGGATLLGWFAETDHTFGYSIAAEINTGGETIDLVTSTVVAVVNGRALNFQATSIRQGDEDRQWTEQTAQLWSRFAISTNREYEGVNYYWLTIKLLLSVAAIFGIFRGVKRLIKMKNEISADL